MKEVILAAVDFVKNLYAGTYDGNNYYHAERVYYLALELVKTEKANNFLVALATLLHSVDSREDIMISSEAISLPTLRTSAPGMTFVSMIASETPSANTRPSLLTARTRTVYVISVPPLFCR